MSERSGPLSHIRVLDLTIARAGPTAVRLLADWGADVIKIEAPRAGSRSITGARRGPDEQNLHRNKRSLFLNLKSDEGRRVFMRLAERSDVVVENFRSDVKFRLGVDYESVRGVNPAIIYASISGFGQSGPYADRPGVDQIVQGMAGLMSITGTPGSGPMRAGIAVSDTSAGMFLGQGILLALLHRERTGEGQWVHTSLLEAMLAKLDFQGARYTMAGEVPQQQGNQHPTMVPMGTFEAEDGLVNIAASSARMWEGFCTALNATGLAEDYPDAKTRFANRDELVVRINELTRQHTVAELEDRLNAHGVPCGAINDVAAAFEDPQSRHLVMAASAPHPEAGDLDLVRSPINLAAFPHPGRLRSAAPDPGADSDTILAEFGFDEAARRQLRDEGVV